MKKGKITHKPGQEHRSALIKLLDRFQHQFSDWQVWDDMVYFCASALAQPCQWIQEREDEYLRRIKRYPKNLQDLFPQMLAELTLAFEQEGFADVLGEMYTRCRTTARRFGTRRCFSPMRGIIGSCGGQ